MPLEFVKFCFVHLQNARGRGQRTGDMNVEFLFNAAETACVRSSEISCRHASRQQVEVQVGRTLAVAGPTVGEAGLGVVVLRAGDDNRSLHRFCDFWVDQGSCVLSTSTGITVRVFLRDWVRNDHEGEVLTSKFRWALRGRPPRN